MYDTKESHHFKDKRGDSSVLLSRYPAKVDALAGVQQDVHGIEQLQPLDVDVDQIIEVPKVVANLQEETVEVGKVVAKIAEVPQVHSRMSSRCRRLCPKVSRTPRR